LLEKEENRSPEWQGIDAYATIQTHPTHLAAATSLQLAATIQYCFCPISPWDLLAIQMYLRCCDFQLSHLVVQQSSTSQDIQRLEKYSVFSKFTKSIAGLTIFYLWIPKCLRSQFIQIMK